MGTSLDRASSVKDLYQRGSAYGIPRRDVDGMDLLTVREALGEAIDRARKEKRPTLLEVETYRYRGHSMSDPGKYRTKEEVEEMMRYDPILRFGKVLKEQHEVAEADLEAHRQGRARPRSPTRSASPSRARGRRPETLYEDVYVRSPYIHHESRGQGPRLARRGRRRTGSPRASRPGPRRPPRPRWRAEPWPSSRCARPSTRP